MFWVITVLVLVVIIAACGILAAVGGGDEPDEEPAPQEKTDTCYLIDAQGLVPGRGGGAGSGLQRRAL